MDLFLFGYHRMSLRASLIVLQILTIVAQIYTLHWYRAQKIHCCAECPGFHETDNFDELDRLKKKVEDPV